MFNGKMEIKRGALSFDIENSIASLLGFRKIIYKKGKYKSQKIIDIMGFNNITFIAILYLELKIMVKIQIYYILLI